MTGYEGRFGRQVENRISNSAANDKFFFKGRLADVHAVSGLALGPEEFGQGDPGYNDEGKWYPKKYQGPWGNTGYHIDFADAGDLGKDVSGNDNHFVAHNAPSRSDDVPDTAVEAAGMVEHTTGLGEEALSASGCHTACADCANLLNLIDHHVTGGPNADCFGTGESRYICPSSHSARALFL